MPGNPLERMRADHPLALERNADFVRFLSAVAGLRAGDAVLDLGCGTAWAAQLLARRGMAAVALDADPEVLALAAALAPEVPRVEADLFALAARPELAGRFSLVLCRGLTAAQRVADWDAPEWHAVGRAVFALLRPGGVLFWTQHGTADDRMSQNGFGNPSVPVAAAWFARHGRLVAASHYELQSYVAMRADAPEEAVAGVAARRDGIVRAQLARHRPALLAGAAPAREALVAVMRCVHARLSPLLVRREPRTVRVDGTGRLSAVARAACAMTGLTVSPDAASALVESSADRVRHAHDALTIALVPDAPELAGACERMHLVGGDLDDFYDARQTESCGEVSWP